MGRDEEMLPKMKNDTPHICTGCGGPVLKHKVENRYEWRKRKYCSHPCYLNKHGPAKDRFMLSFSPEPNSGCWLWTRYVITNGYGSIKENNKAILAHRFAYELLVGPISAGLKVCHACDVRLCVNPSHLFLGTQKENIRDAMRKGRFDHCYRSKPPVRSKRGVKSCVSSELSAVNTQESSLLKTSSKTLPTPTLETAKF